MATSKVIIDTDPGLGEPGSDIDDGLAIALAVRAPELDVLGLTIVNGNVTLATGVHVARNLADRLGVPDLPVLAGADAPLTRDMAPVRALFDAVPGHAAARPAGDLRGPSSDLHAVDWMIEQAERFPGEITVIAIGPMTNLALAIRRSPAFARNVREFVLMAGSATTYAQNITVVGDFNAYVDPEALDIVVRSGARVRMVGLDQTSKVILTRHDADRMLASADPFSQWAGSARTPGSTTSPVPSPSARSTPTAASSTTRSWWPPISIPASANGTPPTSRSSWSASSPEGSWSPTAGSP